MRRNNMWRWIIIAVFIIATAYYLIPTIKYYSLSPEYKENPENYDIVTDLELRSVKRGLDLQGGIRLVMEINLASLVEQLGSNQDERFDEMHRLALDLSKNQEEDFLTIFLRLAQENNLPLELYFESDKRLDENNNVLPVDQYLRGEANNGILQSLEILRNRVDQFGVAEPNIQRQGDNRVIIELAGVDDIERAKQLVGKTAQLEFKLLKSAEVVNDVFDAFDRILSRDTTDIIPEQEDENAQMDSTRIEKAPSTQTEALVSDFFEQTGSDLAEAPEETTVIFDENTFGENPFRSLLANISLYGGWNGVDERNMGVINRLLTRKDFQRVIPTDANFYWSAKPIIHQDITYYELFLLERNAELTGDVITDARVVIGQGYDPSTAGQPLVTMSMNREGSNEWSRITGANIEKRIGIVLDDRVFSAPVVRSQITGGNSSIEGMDSMDEARDLSIILRAGAFAVDMEIIAQQTVGPSLGADSIQKGTTSAILAFIVVICFMLIYYRMAGTIADMALLLNLIFVMAVLAGFNATLTLPGIAGLILTIGMAVDANVLIFERVREELKTGKTIRAAIDSGYSRAFHAILDANVTTLIAAIVLYQFGSGPIKGFALVLMVGIASSMFTAIIFTRCVFDFITSRWTIQKLSI